MIEDLDFFVTSYSSSLFLALTKQIISRIFLFCIMSRDFLMSGKAMLVVTFAQSLSLNPDMYAMYARDLQILFIT